MGLSRPAVELLDLLLVAVDYGFIEHEGSPMPPLSKRALPTRAGLRSSSVTPMVTTLNRVLSEKYWPASEPPDKRNYAGHRARRQGGQQCREQPHGCQDCNESSFDLHLSPFVPNASALGASSDCFHIRA